MNKRIAKERIIYDNYDLWEKYSDDELKEIAIECGCIDENDEVTDEMMMEWRYGEDENDWECEKEQIDKFFKGKIVGFFGEVGRWDGIYKAGQIGEFWELFYKAIQDCAYIKIYDENGHMYLTCSHHDGTCHFEIKEITDKGYKYLTNWEYDWNDKRTEQYIHTQIFNKYSRLPRFMQNVYGCKAREYEPITKGRLIDMLNNQAKSNYA